jgi:hypothetical protein
MLDQSQLDGISTWLMCRLKLDPNHPHKKQINFRLQANKVKKKADLLGFHQAFAACKSPEAGPSSLLFPT